MQNGVIVYLSRERDVGLLYHSLLLLYKNFNNNYRYPVVVFHDDIQKTTVSQLFGALNAQLGFVPQIKFEVLKFEMPSHISSDPALYDPPLTQFGMGYRHMCRLHSGEIYKHPALLQYDWYWRLDSDSFILSPIKYDVFQRMADRGYEYAYLAEYEKEASFVAKGLWDTTKKFISENKERLVCSDFDWNLELYNTNFEIVDMDFFRSEGYQDYFRYLDNTNNIFYHRWGDHAIRYLGMKMFMDPNRVWEVKDFCYQHGGDVKNAELMNMNSVNSEPEPFKNAAMSAYNKGGMSK